MIGSTLVPVLTHSLETSAANAVLFLLFLVAGGDDATEFLTDCPLLGAIVSMKGFQIQRLQILTTLSLHESFCERSPFCDGIIHLLMSAIVVKELTDATNRLIAALPQHRAGCAILTGNGILVEYN
jgi:hypothetical protein